MICVRFFALFLLLFPCKTLATITVSNNKNRLLQVEFDNSGTITAIFPNGKTPHDLEITSSASRHNLLLYNSLEKYDFRLKRETTDNVSLELGRWRFQQRFSENRFAFFVTVSSSFVHLLTIIDRSGHATTEEAIFYVFNAKSDAADGFKNYLRPNSSQVQQPDVIAAVVLVNKFSYALYCHFCPQDRKLSYVIFRSKK